MSSFQPSLQPPDPPSSFQSSSTAQGQVFASQCDFLLEQNGFSLSERFVVSEVGVEIDRVATSRRGLTYWFEYKGSIQGTRPGLRRTDTVKKAVANGALLRAVPTARPYIVLTSHLPETGAGRAMLDAALDLGYITDVICVYTPDHVGRLAHL